MHCAAEPRQLNTFSSLRFTYWQIQYSRPPSLSLSCVPRALFFGTAAWSDASRYVPNLLVVLIFQPAGADTSRYVGFSGFGLPKPEGIDTQGYVQIRCFLPRFFHANCPDTFRYVLFLPKFHPGGPWTRPFFVKFTLQPAVRLKSGTVQVAGKTRQLQLQTHFIWVFGWLNV